MYFSIAMGSNVLLGKSIKGFAILATHKYTTCIPVSGDHQSKLTLMSESLRNDGRIWVPAKLEDAQDSCEEKETNRFV
jgi:succinate dehydrogenase / fumarate reductase flavoprotein subunit